MRKTSIFIRIFTMTAAILLSSYIVLGVSVASIAWLSESGGREAALMKSAETVRVAVSNFAVGGRIFTQDEILLASLKIANDLSGYHVVVTDIDGRVIATSDGTEPPGLYVGEDIVNAVLFNGSYTGSGRLGGVYATNFYSAGLPVTGRSGLLAGMVFVSSHNQSISSMIAQLVRTFVMASTFVLTLSCVWAYFVTRRITRPINSVAEASREFARGNLAVRVPEDAPEVETRELARSFNTMADSLEKTEERRREFIAGISHELKTPMTTIAGYIDGILDHALPEEKHERYLRIVSDETKRLSRLVAQMTEMSRMESDASLKPVRFDLCETTRQVLLSFEERVSKKNLGIELAFDLPVEVIADKDAITRVVYNLADNAVKYADEDTAVYVSIAAHKGKAVFTITDTGKPVSPEERKLIFERFYKADRSRKSEGLGLGLYLAKSIMQSHGEDIRCDAAGRRTSIRFTLPLATNA